ncbi:hypothetical protein [Neotabrizicola sp. sgz301269]|uniref:hypothetical protein n=1 Tax=Neotabrizicola sp. sgz301269 TaxID=3276282 RepID=UPI00377076C3
MIYMTDQFRSDERVFRRPLTLSRILWDNLLLSGSFSATSEDEGFEAERAQSMDTVSWWRPAAGATLTATFTAAEIDCVAIAAHSIGSEGVTATVQVYTGGSWVNAHDPISPETDTALMVAFRPVTATGVRVTLSGQALIGVLAAGKMLVMPQPAYSEIPALDLVRSTTFETNKSVTGQIMGRSITSTSRPFQATWAHIAEDWTRKNFLPFMLSARELPFFAALRPEGYPDDVGYVLTSRDIVPERMGIKNLMRVQVQGEAHVGPTE